MSSLFAFTYQFRRRITYSKRVTQLIDDNQVRMVGPIRQEVLSGYSDKNRLDRLRQKLIYFPNEPMLDGDYESAAEYSYFFRSKGIQGFHTDYLICAVSIRARFLIYTTDKDFQHYSKHLPISLL